MGFIADFCVEMASMCVEECFGFIGTSLGK